MTRLAGKIGRLGLWLMLAVGVGGCASMGQGPCLIASPPSGREFLIIGHRGAPQHACENTIASFAEALDLGANALELDVSMTRDGQLVLWHDWVPTLTNAVRPTGLCRLVTPPQSQPVHTLTLAEFMQAYGYDQEGRRVPVGTLAEFVHHFARDKRVRYVFLDLKVPAELAHGVPTMFTHAAQLLRQHAMLAKAVFSTPDETIFRVLQAEARRWRRMTGERVDIAWDIEGPPGPWPGEWPSSVQRNQTAGTRFALWGIPALVLQSPREFLVQEVQRRQSVNATRPPAERMRFIVWTINDADDLCAAVGLGVDGIMTDEPGRLRAIVRRVLLSGPQQAATLRPTGSSP